MEVKGSTDAGAAQGFRNFITTLGYKRIELKTDGEPALVDVAKKVKQLSEVEVLLKNPPAHDPQSNGVAERAVREVKEQLRATKIALERRLKSKIDQKSQVLLWMVVHSVETINRFLVEADRRTPYYRLYGRNFIGKFASSSSPSASSSGPSYTYLSTSESSSDSYALSYYY